MSLVRAPRRVWSPWMSGNRYDATTFNGGEFSTQAVVANTMYAYRLVPVAPNPGGIITVNAADIRISVNGAASSKARVALYSIGTSGKPGASCSLIAQSIDLAEDPGANTTVDDATFAATLTDLTPVWAVFWGSGAPTVVSMVRMGNRAGISTGNQGAVYYPGWQVGSQTFTPASSTFPATLPAGFVSSQVAPSITFKVA